MKKGIALVTGASAGKLSVFLRWLLSDRLHDAMVRTAFGMPKNMA